jgi:mono/diheme cytochrome c family protein
MTARNALAAALVFAVAAPFAADAGAQTKAAPAPFERGRYLVQIGGCNDCHTAGYAASGGKVPEAHWLVGDRLGWRGPWGTTYASNLRLHMRELTEDAWVKAARSKELRPPMPWFTLRTMTERDLREVYRYVRHLGAAGEPAPAFVPPGTEPKGPFVLFPAPPG